MQLASMKKKCFCLVDCLVYFNLLITNSSIINKQFSLRLCCFEICPVIVRIEENLKTEGKRHPVSFFGVKVKNTKSLGRVLLG